MIKMAKLFPEYKDSALKVKIEEIASKDYYGEGYQDMQKSTLNQKYSNGFKLKPQVSFDESLKIFEAYKGDILSAAMDLQD